jgi:hypothetical protein
MGVVLEQDILRLNVAVDNALFMGVLHGVAELRKEQDGFFDWQRAAALPEQVAQRALANERHDQIEQAVLVAKFDEGQDIGMREPGNGERLAQKARAKGLVFGVAWVDHFQGHFTAKRAQLLGAVDFGHAAAADALDQFIGAQMCSF